MVSVAISCFESAMCSSSIELRLEDRSRFRIITECAQRMPLFNKSSTLEFVSYQTKIGKSAPNNSMLPSHVPTPYQVAPFFTCCWWWCLSAWEKAGWSKMFLWRSTRARPQDDIWRLDDHSDWTRSRHELVPRHDHHHNQGSSSKSTAALGALPERSLSFTQMADSKV